MDESKAEGLTVADRVRQEEPIKLDKRCKLIPVIFARMKFNVTVRLNFRPSYRSGLRFCFSVVVYLCFYVRGDSKVIPAMFYVQINFEKCKKMNFFKGAVSATPLFLFTYGDDKLNCLKEAPKNT